MIDSFLLLQTEQPPREEKYRGGTFFNPSNRIKFVMVPNIIAVGGIPSNIKVYVEGREFIVTKNTIVPDMVTGHPMLKMIDVEGGAITLYSEQCGFVCKMSVVEKVYVQIDRFIMDEYRYGLSYLHKLINELQKQSYEWSSNEPPSYMLQHYSFNLSAFLAIDMTLQMTANNTKAKDLLAFLNSMMER